MSAYARKYRRTLGVDVVAKVLGVYTRIGGELALVQSLYEFQGGLSAVSELAVALHLQRSQVEQAWRSLRAVLFRYCVDRERLVGYGCKCSFALLLGCELALGSGECGVAIYGGKNPVRLWLKRVDFLLSVYDECQRRSLHTSYGQHLTVLCVLQSVKTGGVHAQNPIADGTAQSGNVQRLVFVLVLERVEALAYRLVGH